MEWSMIIQALVVAAVTAVVTSIVNAKVMEAHLKDLRERIVRIETYLNGLLKR